jgi:two-component system chemotaxis response regulator CheB
MADPSPNPSVCAVVFGASAGAMEALGQLLPALPASLPLPIMGVVHLSARTPSLLVPLFAARCALRVCEAEDKLPLEPGVVYFAPPDYHLLIESPHMLALSVDAPVQFSRPSIDVLFHSAAHAFGAGTLGILLSGANDDGSAGLAAIAAAGGRVWVQEPASASARTMPEAALRNVPSAECMTPSAMAAALCLLADISRSE